MGLRRRELTRRAGARADATYCTVKPNWSPGWAVSGMPC